jgi:hypothetical protein
MRSVSGFQLLQFEASGRGAEADAFFAAMKPANAVRVFLMLDGGMFVLGPEEAVAALPALLDRAGRAGYYVELTLFAGYRDKPRDFFRDIARRVAGICVASPACVALELGNELHPLHRTQNEELGDLEFLIELRNIIRARASIPVSLGSTHGGEDDSDRFAGGDYLTIHGDRSGGDDGWQFVRRIQRQHDLSARLGKYVWNDEPRRDQVSPDQHLAMGALCRMFGLGDTFHYAEGRFARPPTGAELVGYLARQRGWQSIPEDWIATAVQTGTERLPARATGTAPVFAAARDGEGYVLAIGAPADPEYVPEIASGWAHRAKVLAEGRVQLWKVSK